MTEETVQNISKTKPSWPKQIYYYLILAGCILFLAIGIFSFLRANLVRFVFPQADYGYYPRMQSEIDSRCKYDYNTMSASNSPKSAEPELNSEEERKDCEQKIEQERKDEVERRYQQEMLNSILMLIVSAIVLATHLKLFKKLEV